MNPDCTANTPCSDCPERKPIEVVISSPKAEAGKKICISVTADKGTLDKMLKKVGYRYSAAKGAWQKDCALYISEVQFKSIVAQLKVELAILAVLGGNPNEFVFRAKEFLCVPGKKELAMAEAIITDVKVQIEQEELEAEQEAELNEIIKMPEILKGGYWNKKFYGYAKKCIYIDGDKIEITPEQEAELLEYANKVRKLEEKKSQKKKGSRE